MLENYKDFLKHQREDLEQSLDLLRVFERGASGWPDEDQRRLSEISISVSTMLENTVEREEHYAKTKNIRPGA